MDKMQEELIENGKVINSANGIVEIELLSNDNCEECSAKLFCNPNKDSTKILKINTSAKYKIGEDVTVTIPGKNILFATFNLYLYPLLILIFTIFVGTKIFVETNYPELFSFLSALIFVTIYYLLFFLISKKVKSVEPIIILSNSK